MASIEFIQNRITGAEAKVSKLEKKMERILKAQAHDWEDGFNPYCYNEYDLRRTEIELKQAKVSLEKYRADLQTEQEKAASRNVKVILEFLENWKKRTTEFYGTTFEAYPEAHEAFTEEMKQFKLDYFEERKLKRENKRDCRTDHGRIESPHRSKGRLEWICDRRQRNREGSDHRGGRIQYPVFPLQNTDQSDEVREHNRHGAGNRPRRRKA